MNLRLPLLAVCLVLPPLAAQTAATTNTAPHVLIESVGPDGWRQRFAPTNLGSLLDSQAGRALWEPDLTPMLGMWQHLVGDQAKFEPARDRLLGYGGRMRLAVWLGEGDLGHRDVFAVALVLEGDGRTDLSALAGDLAQLQRELDGEWAETDVGGSKLRVLTHGSDAMTAPITGEHEVLCVMASQERLAATLANARALAAGGTGKPPAPNTPALRIEVALPALVAMAQATRGGLGGGEQWATMKALGVECLGPLVLTLATAGPHVQFEAAQAFPAGPNGLFAAFFPPAVTVPALQHLLPKDGSWKIGRFDLTALYAAVEQVAAANDVDLDEMRKEMHDEMGIDLRDDLLAHVGDEVLFLGSPLHDVDRLAETAWSLAFRLRDRGAFEKGLDTALAHSKPALSREATIEDGDAKLHRYGNMFGYDLWFAVGGNLFAIAGGSDAEERLKSLFHAEKAATPAAATDAPVLPKTLASLGRHLPAGLNGIASGDLDSLAVIPTSWWLGMLHEVVPFLGAGDDTEPDPEQAEQVRELLRKHQLDVLRTATGYADHTWRWRVFW
jgi:hypothetical protein